MARDEWMLETVAADPSAAAFRTYSWSEPTLSLGYFQNLADARADARWAGVPIVRRATGGGAIWHDHEITYALVVPPGHPQSRRAEYLYDTVHDCLAKLLAEYGLPASRRGEVDPRPPGPRPFLCFLDRDPHDVVWSGHKLIGSAQRRRAGTLLQHGSLLLAGSVGTPELPGLAELLPGSDRPSPSDVAERVLRAAELAPINSGFDPGARARIESLASQVYRDASWTARR
jgi:lipoate-protein ligase A